MTRKTYDKIDSVLLVEGTGEWSALYVNGDLDVYGDHYISQERIAELFGVKIEQSNHFYRGGGRDTKVAQTVRELRAWQKEDEEKKERVKALREEADRLEKELR